MGGSVVLVKSLHPVRNVLQEILQRQATVLPAIPQFYRSMVNAPIHVPLPLRICISGAAPLPAQVLQEFEAKFHIPLIEGYGLSEASPVVTKNPLDRTRKAGLHRPAHPARRSQHPGRRRARAGRPAKSAKSACAAAT